MGIKMITLTSRTKCKLATVGASPSRSSARATMAASAPGAAPHRAVGSSICAQRLSAQAVSRPMNINETTIRLTGKRARATAWMVSLVTAAPVVMPSAMREATAIQRGG